MRAIATDGVHATEPENIVAGVHCLWVELDGHRFEDVVSATFKAAEDSLVGCRLVLEPIGPVELVYVGADDQELHADVVADPASLGRVAYQTVVEGPR